jgi:outer membrane lipoprotein-sorting protein
MSRGASVYYILVLFIILSSGCSARRTADEDQPASSAAGNTTVASTSEQPPRAPITWDDVAKAYERVRDYVCLYEKEERAIANGERQTIRLSFRKPFDVRMEWLNERGTVDQTAVYRQGFNDSKVLGKRSGVFGALAGTVKLDPNDPLALEDSRHPITEAGLGQIIEHAARDAANPQITNRFLGEETLDDNRPAYKFEFSAKEGAHLSDGPQAVRALVWIDKQLMLPVKVEIYDSANALIERHRFKDLRINTKLTDKTFTL